MTELTGVELDPGNPKQLLDELGHAARFVGSALQTTANPATLAAGYKIDAIPGSAQGIIDLRYVPSSETSSWGS